MNTKRFYPIALLGLLLVVSMSIQPLEAVAQEQSCDNIAPSIGEVPQWVLDCGEADAAKGQGVANPTNTFFGFESVADDLSSGLLGTPQVLANLGGTNTTGGFIGACDFAGADLSKIYCLDAGAGGGTLFTVATDGSGTTAVVGVAVPFGTETFTSLDWDPTTGTMYATSTNISAGSLYTINLGAATATRIGALSNACPIAGGFNNAGQMYIYDICTDAMYSVNKATAVSTFVGPLGFDANFGQGMDFDASDDTCQMFAFNLGTFQPEVRTCNTATGATTFVGVIGSTTPGGLTQIGGGGVGVTGVSADLAVTKTVNNQTPLFAETVTFTVSVKNNEPIPIDDIEITDFVPAGMIYVASSSSQGGYDPGTGLWNIGTLTPGSSATLTLTAIVNSLDPITNTAFVSNSTPSASSSASVTITPRAADLSIDKVVNDAAPAVGDVVTFTLTVFHLDGADVNSVRVEDQLPDGTVFQSAVASQGSYNNGTGIWQIGAMTEGQVETLTINAEVTSTASITNVAFIAFASQPDPFPGDNTDAASLNAIAADLEVTKAVVGFENDNGVVTATYLVTVSNEGPSTTGGVVVADRLSADMTLLSVSTSQGTAAAAPPVVTWAVGTLANGGSATMTVVVAVPVGGSLLNIAEVTAADLPDPDSVPGDGQGDDYAAATAGPRGVPDFVPGQGPGGIVNRGDRFSADLALTKDVAIVDGNAVYTITVTNLGPQSTAKVAVTDHLPDCLTYVSSTADKGAYDPTTWVWTVGAVKVGTSATLEIVAEIGDDCDGDVVNTADITSSSLPDPSDFFTLFDEPPTTTNNSAEATFTVTTAGRQIDGSRFALGTNYPNPFNPSTVIPFSLAEASHVSIKVYDLLGRSVATLVDGALSPGVHQVVFEASTLPTGMYLVRMEAGGLVHTQRITLMK